MRLNGWQRIGVIASCLWVLGASIGNYPSGVEWAKFRADEARAECQLEPWMHDNTPTKPRFGTPETQLTCDKIADIEYAEVLRERVLNATAIVTLPVILGWLLIYLSLWLYHWVRRGFQPT